MKVTRFLISAIFGLLSFFIEFVAVPKFFIGWPDPIWIAITVLAPVAIVVFLAEKIWRIPLKYIWIGLPVQYLALFLFREPIAKIWGITLAGLHGLAYLFQAAIWPFIVTLAQFFVLLCIKRSEQEDHL